MKVNVLLRSNAADGFIATVLGWPSITVNGKTKDETLAPARQAVKSQLSQSELLTLDIEHEPSDPWVKFAGMWEDDPTFEDFLEEIAAYRRELDKENGT